MTNRTWMGIVLFVLAQGLAGCEAKGPEPPGGPGDISNPPGGDRPVNPALSVNGVVWDTAFRRLGGATVEVLDGPEAGALERLTNATGRVLFVRNV